MKDPRPLRPNEPVAFFQMGKETEVTFDVDFRRPAKYILLKPTGFRKEPVTIMQNIESTPMELQFFGAIGSTSQSNGLNCVIVNDPALNTSTSIHSALDCQVKLIGDGTSSTIVKNFKIDQLKVFEESLHPETLVKSADLVSKFCKVTGLSLIRITDSSLQLSKIKEV